jgi:hypothetical protein
LASWLTGVNIANNLLDVLIKDCDLDPADWRASMLDRAATNGKALNEIRTVTKYRPVNVPCFSHTLCKPGEAFKAPEAEAVRKAYNKAVLFRGKAADLMKEAFHETAKIAGGVRWWIQYEQVEQMDRFGIDKIMKEVIPICVQKKYSERSVAKLQLLATDLSTPRIMVEFAAIAETGRPFCQATYILEGDDPLVLTAYIVLDQLDQVMEDGVKFERTTLVCKQAASMVLSLRKPLLDDMQSLKDSIANIERKINQLLEKSDTEDAQGDTAEQHAEATATTASQKTTSRVRKQTPKAQAAATATQQQKKAQAAASQRPIDDSQSQPSALATARDKIKTTSDNLKKKQEELEELDKKLVQISEEDFLKHAEEVVEPAFKKYKSLLQAVSEPHQKVPDFMRAKRAFSACKLFDPLFLASDTSINALNALADELVNFGYPEFDEDFIKELKKEIPEAIKYATKAFNWDKVESSKTYHERVLRRARQERQRILYPEGEGAGGDTTALVEVDPSLEEGHIHLYDSWKDDPGERARRIWEWWITWFTSNNTIFVKFSHALRLVVLAQASSAATERVFSQLQYIRNVCGDKLLEDVLNLRTLIRCNGGLLDDFDS